MSGDEDAESEELKTLRRARCSNSADMIRSGPKGFHGCFRADYYLLFLHGFDDALDLGVVTNDACADFAESQSVLFVTVVRDHTEELPHHFGVDRSTECSTSERITSVFEGFGNGRARIFARSDTTHSLEFAGFHDSIEVVFVLGSEDSILLQHEAHLSLVSRNLEHVRKLLRDLIGTKAAELAHIESRIGAWKTLHADFAGMQRQLRELEEKNLLLEQERRQLREQLDIARARIEQQVRELERYAIQVRQLAESASSSDGDSGPTHTPARPDDLLRIRGIGSEHASRLREMGVVSFVQISEWEDDDILQVAKILGISFTKIVQDDWVGQAQMLVAGQQ